MVADHLLVMADLIRHQPGEPSKPGLFTDDLPPLPPPLSQQLDDDSRSCKLVFKYDDLYFDFVESYVSSCRDLICFYSRRLICVHSPSTGKHFAFNYRANRKHDQFTIGLVYVASANVYKIVMFDLHSLPEYTAPGAPKDTSVTCKAITVQEEEEGEGVGVGNNCDDDDDHHHQKTSSSSSWELIAEHDFPPSPKTASLWNLIGVKGVAYAIISLGCKERVLSLDFKEAHKKKKQKRFKIFNLPNVVCPSVITTTLSQVKDHLCLPESTTSNFLLWLLDDRDRTWFRWYTVHYTPPPHSVFEQVVYFPLQLPESTTENSHDGSGGSEGGLFLFIINSKLVQYDTRTKEAKHVLPYSGLKSVHVFSRLRSFSLKNGLTCPKLPPLPVASCPPLPSGPPPPEPPLPCEPLLPAPPPPHSRTPLPLAPSLPLQLPLLSSVPPQLTHALPRQYYLPPPPAYYYPPTPHVSLPPLPPYYHQNLQHTAYWAMPHLPPPQGFPPPPPNPQNSQYQIYQQEATRRKLFS